MKTLSYVLGVGSVVGGLASFAMAAIPQEKLTKPKRLKTEEYIADGIGNIVRGTLLIKAARLF